MITSKLEPAAPPSVDIVIGPEKVKPAKAEPVKPEPEVKTPKSEEVEAKAPEAEPSPEEDDAPKKNVFLPDRKPGSSTPKTKPRFGR